MPQRSNRPEPDLDLEAARIVLAYLERDRSARDAALAAWAKDDPARCRAAERALTIWALSAPAQRRERRSARRRSVIALGVAAVVAAVVVWRSLPVDADLSASSAMVAGVVLADGVLADLDAGTALDVVSETDVLLLHLHAGAVHLSVEPGIAPPAVTVMAADVATTVTGTRFAVTHLPEGVGVAVAEGSVEVDASTNHGAPVAVIEGQIWRGRETGGAVAEIDPAGVASWRRGVLTVRNRPLREVADVLARRYAGRIVFADAVLAEARVSGTFSLTDPLSSLRAAASAHAATVTTVTPWLAIVRRP
ncbi:MAG: FecR domain-containing protein [Pseudomonadota bacterium]